MTSQVLFFDVFFEKDPHLNAVEGMTIHYSQGTGEKLNVTSIVHFHKS